VSRIDVIWQGDRLARELDMTMVEAAEGYARVAVQVQEGFLNVHGVGHGALLFAVAEVAFGLAISAITDAVGVQWSLNIFRPALAGRELIGEARILHQGRRSLVCELSVSDDQGRLLLRGQATALPLALPAQE
jgi:acyl-CoA thioesterase